MTAPLIASSSRATSRLASFSALPRVIGRIAAAALLTGSSLAGAQSAYYSGAQFSVGSGFSAPYGVALDSSGNVYVADANNNTVTEIVAVNGSVSASSTLLTLGSGFNSPIGVAVDTSGNVYVADEGNGLVKEIVAVNGSVPANPTILTLGATYGFEFPIAVAIDLSGNVYVTDAGTLTAVKIPAGNGTPTTIGSGFTSPAGIAVDNSGNVYVVDSDQTTVTEIPVSGPTIAVGSGFSSPFGIAVDGSGNVFVSEAGGNNNPTVQEVLAGSGTIVPVGSNYSYPEGIAVGPSGDVFVADAGNTGSAPDVAEIVTRSLNFGTVNVGATSTRLSFNFTFLTGGTISAPAIFTGGVAGLDFADAGTGSCTTNGNITYNAGDSCSVDITFKPQSAGTRSGAIVLQDSNGNPIGTAYTYGIGSGPQVAFTPGTESKLVSNLNLPGGAAVDASGSLYLADTANNRVLKETLAGGSYTQSTIGTGLSSPSAVAVDAAGNVYIADTGNTRVLLETPAAGSYTQSAPFTSFSGTPQGLAVDPSGNLYIAAGSVVEESLANGTYIQSTLTTPGVTANSLAADGSGNLFVVDSTAGQVIRLVPSSGSTLQVGNGLSAPSAIAADAFGNVYIADQGNNRIVKEAAANGSYTQSTLPTSVLNAPSGVAVDSNGNVYIADQDNIVLKEDLADAPSFVFATTTPAGTTDTTDPTPSFALTNIGNAALNGSLAISSSFTQVPGSGNPTDCTATISLVAGAACNVSVEFSPVASAASGAVSGTEIFSDNNLNANPNVTQTIYLSGTTTAAAGATQFVVTSAQNTVGAGTSFNITITAEGTSGNVITSYNNTVMLTSTDPNFSSTGSITFTNGVATVAVTLATVGQQTITATSTTGTNITGSVQVTVLAGAPALVTILAGADQNTYINSAFATQLQLMVVDAYGNAVSGASVLFSAPSSGASATFAVPNNSNTNQTIATTGVNGIATASIATANSTAGQYNVSAGVVGSSIASVNFLLVNLSASQYVVTTLADDAGTASNCVDQANGSGDNTNCSLRDAVAAVDTEASTVSGTITFASSLTTTPQTITLTNGPLTLTGNVTITGPAANLLTVSGGNASQILTVGSGVIATVSGLSVANGSVGTSGTGAAIYNNGILFLTSATVSGNTASGSGLGGGIYNDQNALLAIDSSTISGNTAGSGGGIYNAASGIVAIVNSTVSGNTANGGAGGGIYSDGSLSVKDSTVAGNSTVSAGNGGGIYTGASSTLSMENSIVAANTAAGQYADLDPLNGFVPDSSNIASVDPGATSLLTPSLAPLGNYGGSTQTMIPLPGSPAICGGLVANIPSGVSMDERGNPRTTTYASTACVDAGAVQTTYSLLFLQQPTNTAVATSMIPAPTVQLNESGAAFTGAPATVALTLTGAGTLTGGSTSTANGVATYSTLSVDTAGTGDTLTASLTLDSNTTISTTSNSFNIIAGTSQLAFGTPPAANVTVNGNAGSAITVQEENAGGTVVTTAADAITLTVTGPGGYSQTYTATAVNGVASFNLSTVILSTAGPYVYTASTGSLSNAVANETVSATPANTVAIVSGSGQSASIGSAFAQALSVKVLDASNNPVSGAVVSFSAPGTGASASLSSSSATTGSNGTASIMATANGTASINPYNVTATVTGNTANFSLTNAQAPTSLTVVPSSTGLFYGQPVTIKATISPASVLTTTPTGSITFYDGTTALPPAVTVAAAIATDTVAVPAVGSHTYGAQYGGDTNFGGSPLKSAGNPLVVSKASATLNGPAKQPVTFPVGLGGTTQVTLVGQFSGTGISQPGGSVSYTVNGTTDIATITNGTATITIPATWPVGQYTMTVTYSGDGNYNASPSITIPFSITSGTTVSSVTTLKATPTSTPYGGSVTFTATVIASSGSNVPTGSVTFNSGATRLGTGTLNGSGIATFTTTTLPIGTESIIASYAGDTIFSASSSSGVQVTVAPLSTTTTLTGSEPTAVVGASVVFTATVTPATPVATGSVTFNDGTVALGTGTLNASGIATYTTTSLSAGTHSITAVYAGDSTHATSTSSPFTETITGGTTGTQTFSMTANASTVSIAQGQSGTVSFTLTALNGFNQPVTLSCGNLPALTTCTMPATVTPTAAGVVATVTINTDATAATAGLHSETPGSGSFTALAGAGLAGLALLIGIPARKRLGRFSALYSVLMAVILSGALAAMSLGCGGGSTSAPTKTPLGTTTVTVTGTAGSGSTAITQTVTIQLTVTE